MFSWRRHEPPAFVRAYEAGPWPARSLRWRETPFAVLDIETSGLDPRRDALLAIGVVEIEAARVRLDRCWHSLVRPPEDLLVNAESIRIHGLTRAELAAAPSAAEALPELLKRLRGRCLVVHVAQIDVGFLNRALRELYRAKLRGPILDTARIALALHQQARLLGEASPHLPAPAIQLRALAGGFGLPVYPEHDALNDALTTAQLLLAQATRLERQGGGRLGDLLRAGGV
jgi:DNA polymerase-3 subunit epsilon